MADDLKGMLVAFTLAALFTMAVFNFVTLFPQEQGYSFSTGNDNQTYLLIQSEANTQSQEQLISIGNQTSKGFDEWDVTQGFMGSNTIKQTSKSGVLSYATSTFDTLRIVATQLFGENSPILYVIGAFAVLASGYILYLVIQFVRTGRWLKNGNWTNM